MSFLQFLLAGISLLGKNFNLTISSLGIFHPVSCLEQNNCLPTFNSLVLTLFFVTIQHEYYRSSQQFNITHTARACMRAHAYIHFFPLKINIYYETILGMLQDGSSIITQMSCYLVVRTQSLLYILNRKLPCISRSSHHIL